MSYLNYDGLAYFKSKLTNWVDQNYLSKTNTGNTTVAGNVTFTNPVTGDLDGKAKKDWLGQKIDETYIKSIATNDNAGTIVYTKGNGSTNHILIDLLQGATPVANGRAGLVPAPTVSEMNYFLRGDGNWAVPTDVYVNQNLIASSNNNQFPILLSGTSGTPATKTNATVGYTNVVSVNPMTNALMASQFISKHPTYNRQNTITSKVQYSLNFTDIVSGAGHNLGEVVGYVDTLANGGEHELGLRLFGNPNVQGTEEDYVYMGVGLSNTNVAYGHAPSTPLPSAHNEPTDIITRDWLARNGSETGLVHTSMDETIGGIKTFTAKTVNNSSAGIVTTKLTASDKITGTGTAEFSGGSGATPSLKVTGNETITGDLNVGGNEIVAGNETVIGNISTTNGTVSAKTGSIGTGGLTVTGPSNLNGKVTAGNGLDVTGNEIVSGNLTVGGTTTTDDLSVTDDATIGDTVTIGGQVLKKTGTNTTQEYVSYVTNQQETRNTIITNVVKPNGGLAIVDSGNDKGKIYVKAGNALEIDSSGFVNVDFSKLPPEQVKNIVDRMVDPDGAIIGSTQATIPAGETYHYYDANGNLVSAVAPAGGIANPNYGKLTVDFSKLEASQIESIVMAMIDRDGQGNFVGGLSTNPNTGKLVVDFSQIDENTKNDILKNLSMLIPLSGNKVIHIDNQHANTSDTLDENRGALNKPFETIQAAIDYITQTYALGTYNVYFYVHSGTYDEIVYLRDYSTSGGVCVLAAYDSASKPIIHYTAASHFASVRANDSIWYLRYFKIINNPVDSGQNPGSARLFPYLVRTGENGRVYIEGCDCEFECTDTGDNSRLNMIMFSGNISFYPVVGAATTFKYNKGTAYSLTVLNADGSSIAIRGTDDAEAVYEIPCQGDCTTFALAANNGFIGSRGAGAYFITFVVADNATCTGRKYQVLAGSGIKSNQNSDYPGDVEGTVQTATNCWYA